MTRKPRSPLDIDTVDGGNNGDQSEGADTAALRAELALLRDKAINRHRKGKLGTTIHFSPEAHADLHLLQGDMRSRLTRAGLPIKGAVSKQDCMKEAMDNWFEALSAPRHFCTTSNVSVKALQERLANLEAESAQLKAELAAQRTSATSRSRG